MTLDQLRVFVAVAECLHVTRAARQLNMTQSAASAAIAALETSCDLKLFDRIGRNITLTSAGQDFLIEAKAVMDRAAQAQRALAELSGLERGHLTIFASQTIANYWLPPLLHRFHQLYPKIGIGLTIGNTGDAARAISNAEADLGFIEGAIDNDRIACTPVAKDELVLVVGTSHSSWDSSEIAPGALAAWPWVLREKGSGTRQVFEDAIRGYGIEPSELRVALELPSNEAVLSAVKAGAGATVVSSLPAAAGLLSGRLKRIGLSFPERHFSAIRHRERTHSKAEAALLALIGPLGR